MRTILLRLALTLCCTLSSACGSDFSAVPDEPDPVDAEGNYMLTVTNRDNGCGFGTWQEGTSSVGVPLYITQVGDEVEATIGGLTGGLVDLWLGERTFEGDIVGNEIRVALDGTKAQTLGDCSYTIDVEATATLTGDALEGTLEYVARTGAQAACATLAGCASHQELIGTRPSEGD